MQVRDVSTNALDKALYFASFRGNQKTVEFLLKKGSVSSKGFEAAFKAAVQYKHWEIIKLFLEGPILPETLEKMLYFASVFGNQEIVKLLLKKGDVSSKGLGEAFNAAALYDHWEIVKFFLEEPIPFEYLEFVLEKASSFGNQEVVEFILKKREVSSEGLEVAFEIAVQYKQTEIVKLFLEARPILLETVEKLLHWASIFGNQEVVEILLKKNKISVETRGGVVVVASLSGCREIVDLLLKMEIFLQRREERL